MSGYLQRLLNVGAGLAARPDLARAERMARRALRARQQARLNRLVAYAADRSPFWKQRLQGLGASSMELSRIPPVTKDELMERFDEAVTDPSLSRAEVEAALVDVGTGDALFRGRYRLLASGGSSGRRGVFVYGKQDWRGFLRGVFRWTRFIGINPAVPRPRVSSVSAPDAKHMTFRGAASIDVGMFKAQRLSAATPLNELVTALNAFRPDFLFAYASMARLLAEEQRAGRLHVELRGACTTSELRTPDVTASIEAAFGVTPYDCYATTETGIAAVDCEHHCGLHIFEDLCILEVVDRDLRPVPDGQPGERLLVTNLNNFTQPMIRVVVDDLLQVTADSCPCGRTFRRIENLSGRSDDVLQLPGRHGTVQVHPIRLRSRLAGLAEIVEYQIVQRRATLEVLVVPGRDARGAEVARRAERTVREALASAGVTAVDVTGRAVPHIDRGEGAAKLKLVRVETSA